VNRLQRLFPAAALLGLPALASGFAFTTATTSDQIISNQDSGQAIIWNIPQQAFIFNFGGDYDLSAESAMEDWNNVNTSLQYQLGTNTAATCGADGNNSGGWGTLACDHQPFGDALAITQRWYHKIGGTWYLSEADIVLDKSRNWQIYSGPLRQNVQDFRRVILHELGHALGLDHPDEAGQTVTAIMNSHTSGIETLQTDDKNGISSLYSGGFGSTTNTANQTTSSSGGGGGGFAISLLALAALSARRVQVKRWEKRA